MTTPKILIVEDQLRLAAGLEAEVQELGYWVVGPAVDLESGIDMACREEVDFALLDYDLGRGNDSTPIAEALANRGIPFAFVTGEDASFIHALFPTAHVLSKPVDQRRLAEVLAGEPQRLLCTRRPTRAALASCSPTLGIGILPRASA